jgi:hypothetical protein
MASAEVMTLSELSAGDPVASQLVSEIQSAIGTVSRTVRSAAAEAEKLKNDDLSNPIGIARRLEESPKNLEAVTHGLHEKVDSAIAVLEARLTSLALQHDPANDLALREEIGHRIANLKASDAGTLLVTLAATPRYATLMAGFFGDALAARYGVDPAALIRAALQSVAENGTPNQRRAAGALASRPKAARVLALSKAGVQDAARAIREPKRAARSAFSG